MNSCSSHLRSAAESINSGRHILESRCEGPCANDTFLTLFRATSRPAGGINHSDSDGACVNYAIVPQFPWIWKRADRVVGKRKTDTCGPQRKGRLGEKKDGRFSIVSTVGSGLFCFQHGEVASFLWQSQNVLVKRTRASRFLGLVTDPKLLCPIAMKSAPPKNIRVCWAFFRRKAHQYPKILCRLQ